MAGLLCGVALKHAGHEVTILEREDDERNSHMAGVCLGLDAAMWLDRHDRQNRTFSHRSTRVQLLKKDQSVRIFSNVRREITSWDAWYHRLRSLFDGYVSSYYPSPPQPSNSDGVATYEAGKEVLDLKRAARDEDGMLLTLLDRKHHSVSTMEADIVIAADGPDSVVRAKYLPSARRQYVGYIAWRGTVRACDISADTRNVFRRSVTVHMMPRHHCIVYTIPGADGSLDDDKKLLNFLWYTNETLDALDDILKDGIDGHRHHNIVPAGHVREDIWNSYLERAAAAPFPSPLLEIITKIQRPFIQVITDHCSTSAAFEGGRVLLVGDALSLFRPHTAFSSTQAAFHALRVEDYLSGKISLAECEEEMLRYSHLHWLQSIWWGKFYQSRLAVALLCGLRYWFYCGIDRVKSWWKGELPLLRTSSDVVEEYGPE